MKTRRKSPQPPFAKGGKSLSDNWDNTLARSQIVLPFMVRYPFGRELRAEGVTMSGRDRSS